MKQGNAAKAESLYQSTSEREALAQSLYQHATEMIPTLRKRQRETAALGHLPPATIEAMQAAGFFRIMQPARYGGYELDPEVFFRVQMLLAQGCMSTAWVLGVVAIHNWQLALFDDRAQAEVWGDNDATLISSSYMPVGKVEPVDGGFKLSGHWGFSSGSKHCAWAFLGGMVPPTEAGGAPDYRTFLVPRRDYEIVENWDVSGLEGTGSHDITVYDAFVPEYRTHRAIHGFECNSPGNAVNEHYIFRLPFGQIFVRAVSSSSIGCLQGVIDSYVTINKDRVGLNDGNKIASDPDAQMALAECIAAVDECQTIMLRNFDEMVRAAQTDQQLDIDRRIKMRFDAALVSRKCTEAINLMFNACGAQGIFKNHPLNRAWLDINAGRQHVANNPFKFGRNVGAVMMGKANEDFFL
jgi:3-hydroxy-9,10-secoandrosta-1,3,5(10)-triene-9,17-dione monooxygenase